MAFSVGILFVLLRRVVEIGFRAIMSRGVVNLPRWKLWHNVITESMVMWCCNSMYWDWLPYRALI